MDFKLHSLGAYNEQHGLAAKFWQKPLRTLPRVNIIHRIERDRCIYDGYQRGGGIQYGPLRTAIWRDPLYQMARRKNSGRSSWKGEQQRMNLYLIIRFFLRNLESQNVIEFGTYPGGNALFIAALLKELYPAARLVLADAPTSFAEAESTGLKNVELVGSASRSTVPEIDLVGPFGLLHVDTNVTDIHSIGSYETPTAGPQMCPGGYIVYEDIETSSAIEAAHAVEQLTAERSARSEQVWPHLVFRAPPVSQ